MRRKPRNIEIALSDKGQTHFGGVHFFQEFLALLQLRKRLSHALKDQRPRTRYSTAQMVLALVYPIVLGLERLEAAFFLRSNGIFQYLTGLPQFPNPTTLRRFLYQASPPLREQLSRFTDRLSAALLQQPHQRSRLLLDFDSTSLVVYGQQERARVAYTPHRHGARSYEPLLCFDARSGLFWAATLRPGGGPGAAETIAMLEHGWAMAPTSIREVRVRADAGFYRKETLTWLEHHGASYAIVARLTVSLKRRVLALRYRPLSPGYAVAELKYQAHGWPYKRRIIAVRKQLKDRDSQPTLFILGRYAYHAYVTNLDLEPENVWRFYNSRAGLEGLIKELKYDYGLGHIPTRRFAANAFYLEILRLAYNLVVGFQTLCLPASRQQATLGTIRRQFLLLPAVLARPQGRPVLRFPRSLPMWRDCEYVMDNLKSLQGQSLW